MARTKTKTQTKQEAGVALKTREDEVREQIREIADTAEKGFVTLAALLSEAYHSHYYSQWGFEDFASYADNECATGYRKARYLVNTLDKMMNLGVPLERAEAIGWTKMREIIKIMNAENMEELLDEVEGMTYKGVTDYVKITKQADLDAGGVPIQHKLTIVLGEDTNAIVTDALTMAKGLINTDSNALALAMICQDWMSAQDESPQATTIEHIAGYVKKVFGVDIAVCDSVEEKKDEEPAEKVAEEKPKAKAKAKAKAEKKVEPADTKKEDVKAEKSGKEQSIDDILGI